MASPIKLSSLVIYNPTYGTKEGEEEKKLLYYYPENEKLNSKINNVGLYEALVQFTKNLTPNDACDFMHTAHHHYIFLEPEDNFWMVMVLSNPVAVGSDGKPKILENEINDVVYGAVLKEIYNRFCFLHGTFLDIFQLFTVDGLREKLRVFNNELLNTLQLSKCDILSMCNGVHYCSLEKSGVLGFQSFISSIQDKYKNIKHCLILHDHSLIMSTLGKVDTQVLVKLLREKLLLDLPFSKRFKMAANAVKTYQLNHGRFLDQLFDGTDNTVFVNVQDDRKEQMHIIVYQAFSITSCYILDCIDMPLIQYCKVLDRSIGPQLAALAKTIPTTQANNAEFMESHLKHVFFDRGTLSIESSCHSTQAGKTVCSAPTEVIKVVNDIGSTLGCSECQGEEQEIITKVHSDNWVAMKKINERELFVVVNRKNVNLIEVSDDLRRAASHFDNIHFTD